MIPTRPRSFKSTTNYPNNPWQSICHYLHASATDIRKNICRGCGFAKLADKNNKVYTVTRNNTLDQVKAIVEEIRLTNTQTEQP